MRWRPMLFLAFVVALASCQRVSVEEARQTVARYNQVVCEAYRRGDVKLIDSVVGPNTTEGRKLTGLIGVRLDMGITLDADLLSLEVTGIEQEGEKLQIRTKERWHYRDLKIGSGKQVGEESLDYYELLYIFKKIDKTWLVEETRFSAPPQVGRKTMPWQAERRLLHGFTAPTAEKKSNHP